MFIFYSDDYNDLETRLHRELKEFKLNGDWYNCNVFNVINRLIDDKTVSKFDFPSLNYFYNKISKFKIK